MTPKELRSLDAWIAEHVPPHEKWPEAMAKWNGKRADKKHPSLEDCSDFSMFHPTTDPAAAMKVLKCCATKGGCDQISIVECEGTWCICEGDGNHSEPVCEAEAETLETAIALFAQKLFSK